MKKFHLGIDFGTYQSKACVYNFQSLDHEFFRFDNQSYFFPSRVVKKGDGTFGYGDIQSDEIIEEYLYFKMEAAEDEEFHFVSYEDTDKIKQSSFYKFNDHKSYTPEFLSVIYLTYVQLTIKEFYKKKSKVSRAITGGNLLSRLFSRTNSQEDEILFTTKIGIPTEWSQKNNLKRKRKFENILFISEKLQHKYDSILDFENAQSSTLIEHIKEIYELNKEITKEQFKEQLNSMGLSVYPETAAGLAFIINTKQLPKGFYAAMDIGAGTTDVSFFEIVNHTIKYLASESYIIATNNIYKEYKGQINSIQDLSSAQNEVQKILNSTTEDKTLNQSVIKVKNILEKRIYKLFNKRVYYFSRDMVKKYDEQPIIIYGGGSNLPLIFSNPLVIHDNGSPISLTNDRSKLEKIDIKSFSSNINLLPRDESWKPFFSMLVVALGLSYVQHETDAEWFDESKYNSRDGDRKKIVAHPSNEGYYVYDILK
tara:strand:- start:362 stop:1804 length:1443 start_codon:yes stop_codon:yes gene_type:complete